MQPHQDFVSDLKKILPYYQQGFELVNRSWSILAISLGFTLATLLLNSVSGNFSLLKALAVIFIGYYNLGFSFSRQRFLVMRQQQQVTSQN